VKHFSNGEIKYAYSYLDEPVGRVSPSETFQIGTQDCYTGLFRSPAGFTPENIDWVGQNLDGVTGPIYVEGATPGQVVAISIHDIKVTTPGSVALSQYSYPSPEDWWLEEAACKSYPIENNEIVFSDSVRIPVKPLIGCVATAPAREVILSRHEGSYGGNMDCNEITVGSTLILPVAVEGAYLYFGDCKARMGDGEIAQPPEVGTLITASVELRPAPARMHCPRIETREELITVVSARTIEDACREAFKELLFWIEDDYSMERQDAAMLMAMLAHAGICQVSNTFLTAKCKMPRAYLPH